tara:strand:+ start:190 stop:369 length:180 start_codon:yes stop_codon:yes gene_type:complete
MITANFNMMHHHNYSLTELDNMIPWEREIYVIYLLNILQKKMKEYNEKTTKGKVKCQVQ